MLITIGSTAAKNGKSIFLSNLAAHLASQGKSVAILDACPSATITQFLDKRAQKTYLPTIAGFQKRGALGVTLSELGKKFDYVLCDTAGGVEEELKTALPVTDLFIMPIEAGVPSLKALDDVCELLGEVRELADKAQFYTLTERRAFADTFDAGLGITETREFLAANEFLDIVCRIGLGNKTPEMEKEQNA